MPVAPPNRSLRSLAPNRSEPLTHTLAVDRALMTVSFKQALAYKSSWFIGLILAGGGLLVGMALWHHLLDERSLGGYDWAAMRAYLIIGFLTATLAFGADGWYIAERILDGMVAIDLTKPVDFQRARAAEFVGNLVSQTPTGIVGVVGAWLLFSPPGPVSPLAGLLTVVSIVLIIPLAFEIIYISTLVCFWTKRYLGIMWVHEALLGFFSGMVIPLALMPTWLQALSWALPFPHFTTTPTSIYLGRVDTLGALGLIAAEAAWVVGLWLGARLLWRHAVKSVTVHGG